MHHACDKPKDVSNVPKIVEINEEPQDLEEESSRPFTPRRTRRERAEPSRLTYLERGKQVDGIPSSTSSFAFLTSHEEPLCVEEALSSKEWFDAMLIEYNALMENQTWVLCVLPNGKKSIGCKWVFKLKLNQDGSICKFKARLVAKGFAQTKGLDYEETFAPVAKMVTIRVFIALASHFCWFLFHMDVSNAFINGFLEEDIYMEQPQGFIIKGEEDKVCHLRRSLYGLKQAARVWYSRSRSFLTSIGFVVSDYDSSLYIKHGDEGSIVLLLIYVDDIILGGNNLTLIDQTKSALCQEFKMVDLGSLHYILGIEVNRSRDYSFICQSRYILHVLKRFNMLDCKSVETPMEPIVRDPIEGDEASKVDITLYRSLIGSLLWLTITRPDISFSVCRLSQYMQNPSTHHWKMAKRILRYLSGTKDYGILYRGDNICLHAYSDADFAGCKVDRKSTSAFVTFMGEGAISWLSKKQSTVSLSSTKAAYKALTTTTKEILLEHVSNVDCLADLLTKPLPRGPFIKLRSSLNIMSRSLLEK